jgi:hypothetical protein
MAFIRLVDIPSLCGSTHCQKGVLKTLKFCYIFAGAELQQQKVEVFQSLNVVIPGRVFIGRIDFLTV